MAIPLESRLLVADVVVAVAVVAVVDVDVSRSSDDDEDDDDDDDDEDDGGDSLDRCCCCCCCCRNRLSLDEKYCEVEMGKSADCGSGGCLHRVLNGLLTCCC